MSWPRRLLLSLLVACSTPAIAAAQSIPNNVQLNQYQPTPFSDRILRLDGTSVLPFGQFRIGLDVDYGLRPLILIDAAPGIFQAGTSPNHNVVEHAVGGALLASFGLGHRLEAGISVPLTIFQSGQTAAGGVAPSVAGLGNVRLGVKAHLLDWRGLGAGAAVLVAVPAGIGTLTHETGIGGEARLFADYTLAGLTIGGRAGFRLRKEQAFYDIPLGNELTFATGAAFRLFRRTTVFAELAGATAVSKPFGNAKQSPLEALGGLTQRIGKTWLSLAAGPGIQQGYGSPIFRVVAAFTWANVPPDADSDGVPDDDDRCPTDPEDRDGFEDQDGCPDPDNDKDGIPDAADKCPVEPETVNEFEDDDGCPDEGSTTSDKDKDGIPDETDECPEEPEDKDGFEDEDGCPDPDNDKDGIPDATDKCPLEPETINGVDDDDGCPDKGQTQVRLGKNEIETLKPIFFDTDRSRVRHAFYSILGQIALLLKAHPEIGRCAIEGHTDDTGPDEWNQKLSVLRAESVIEFLANKGVDRKRLVPIGHGENLPWASNQTPWGRAKNRRVVFHIEGVSAEEKNKQEQRQERRRHIRRAREREQRKQDDAARAPGGGSDSANPDKTDAPKDKTEEPKAPPAGDKTPSKGGAAPKNPNAPASPGAPADVKGGAKSSPKPGAAPPAANTPGAPTSPRQGTSGAPKDPAAAEASETDDASTAKSGANSARPRGPAKRPPPEPGTGQPPTLRELLKLPPR